MKIAYINPGTSTDKPKKLSKKEAFHQEALLTVANATMKDRERAKEFFKAEREEVEALQKELEILNTAI